MIVVRYIFESIPEITDANFAKRVLSSSYSFRYLEWNYLYHRSLYLSIIAGIDTDFETLLSAIFGADFIRDFRLKRPSGWVNLMLAFESKKRAATPFKIRQPLNVSLPFSFIDYYKKVKVGGGMKSFV